ncbi:MAG: hypothetical protein H7263_08750 [Candidatus Sericytochromatia bacterium]|nr:hypothetical protein [Candidatus Sericytochromatia bacterium]
MKLTKLSNLLLITLLVASCSNPTLTNNIPNVNTSSSPSAGDFSTYTAIKLSSDDISRFDKEYSAYTNLALISTYYQSNLTKLIGDDNGLANAVRIIQQLEYAQYRGNSFISFNSIFASNPSFYNTLIGLAAVIRQRSLDASFDSFITNSNPSNSNNIATLPTFVTPLSPSEISSKGFTANWIKSDSATLGYLLTIKKGDAVIKTVSIDSQFTTSQLITGLPGGIGYTYSIQGRNNFGLGISSTNMYIYMIADNSVIPSNIPISSPTPNNTSSEVISLGTFFNPKGIATDSVGNIYVAELGKIGKVSPSGVITLLAGSSDRSYGYIDATGTNARFRVPQKIAVDSKANVYVTGTNDNDIRKVSPAGVVTTFAGSILNAEGYVNATGTDAKFYYPNGLATDSNDNIYVTESNTSRIRKISPAGVVTTFIESIDGITAISGIATDPAGNIYIAESSTNKIRKISPAGVITTFANSTKDENGRYLGVSAIAVDSKSNVYIAESYINEFFNSVNDASIHDIIRKISPSGVVTNLNSSFSAYVLFSGITVDSSGNVYATESDFSKVVKIKQ